MKNAVHIFLFLTVFPVALVIVFLALLLEGVILLSDLLEDSPATRMLNREMYYAVDYYMTRQIASNRFSSTALSNIVCLSEIPIDDLKQRLRRGIRKDIIGWHIHPRTGLPYIFSPVTADGRVIYLSTNRWEQNTSLRVVEVDGVRVAYDIQRSEIYRSLFWLWEPEPSRCGDRMYIWDYGHSAYYSDDEVSWYYQTRLNRLSPTEVMDEMLHRYTSGLPPITVTGLTNYFSHHMQYVAVSNQAIQRIIARLEDDSIGEDESATDKHGEVLQND